MHAGIVMFAGDMHYVYSGICVSRRSLYTFDHVVCMYCGLVVIVSGHVIEQFVP